MASTAPDEGVDKDAPSPGREGGARAEASKRSMAVRTSSQASKVKEDADIIPSGSKEKQKPEANTGRRSRRKPPESEGGSERAEDARGKETCGATDNF